MKFKLQNQYLNGAIQLMQRMPLAGYDSMARTRFIKVLGEPFQALSDSKKELLEEYVRRDEKSNPVIKGNNYQLIPDRIQDYQNAYNKLTGETAEIDKPTYTNHLKDVQRILRNSTLQLADDDATIYAALCEALEVNFEEEV